MTGYALTLVWLAWCARHDYLSGKIPNHLALVGFLVATAWLLLTGKSMLGEDAASSLYAFGVALAMTLPGYALRSLGGGDVKVFLALSLMVGLSGIFYMFTIAFICFVTVVLLLKRFPVLLNRVPERVAALYGPDGPAGKPLAPFIALAFVLMIFIR